MVNVLVTKWEAVPVAGKSMVAGKLVLTICKIERRKRKLRTQALCFAFKEQSHIKMSTKAETDQAKKKKKLRKTPLVCAIKS